jgi:hypothetical protein
LDGLVVAFDPNGECTPAIQFDDGSTKSVILNGIKFKWIVEDNGHEITVVTKAREIQ